MDQQQGLMGRERETFAQVAQRKVIGFTKLSPNMEKRLPEGGAARQILFLGLNPAAGGATKRLPPAKTSGRLQ
jgi:hypothetical protein